MIFWDLSDSRIKLSSALQNSSKLQQIASNRGSGANSVNEKERGEREKDNVVKGGKGRKEEVV